MARAATGSIVEHATVDGTVTCSLRVTVDGQRQFISLGDCSRERAEAELDRILDEIKDGTWDPSQVTDVQIERAEERELWRWLYALEVAGRCDEELAPRGVREPTGVPGVTRRGNRYEVRWRDEGIRRQRFFPDREEAIAFRQALDGVEEGVL